MWSNRAASYSSASVGPYSATVAPNSTKPAMPIHRGMRGSAAISRPGMSHRSVIFMINPNSHPDDCWSLSVDLTATVRQA